MPKRGLDTGYATSSRPSKRAKSKRRAKRKKAEAYAFNRRRPDPLTKYADS